MTSDSEECSEDEDEVMELAPIKPFFDNKVKHAVGRSSVAGDKYTITDNNNYKPKFVYKTSIEKKKIKEVLNKIFMFSVLDDEHLDQVIDAIDYKRVIKDEMIIKEGDIGDSLYIVSTGSLDCKKKLNGKNKFLRKYNTGELFGELALLYNCPRGATLTALENSKLYVLDRETFNHIVKGETIQKRKKFDEFLSKVPILESLNENERSTIIDCIKIKKFTTGEEIIKQV